MKKIILFLLCCATITQAVIQIDPQPTDGARDIAGRLGQAFDETTPDEPMPIYETDFAVGLLTITTPGNYILTQDMDNRRIVIDANGVSIDLNRHQIRTDASGQSVIKINAGHHNVQVCNGYVKHKSPPGNGLDVGAGCSLVRAYDLVIEDCTHGVELGGQEGNEVIECELIALDLVSNVTGVQCTKGDKNVIRECRALGCIECGVEVRYGRYNQVLDCYAVETTNNDPDKSVQAFVADGGVGNLFERCTAKRSYKGASNNGTVATGFTLTGTEEDTKLIECLVNTSTLLGDGESYGMLLTWTTVVIPGSPAVPSSFVAGDTIDAPANVTNVSWSHDESFFALLYGQIVSVYQNNSGIFSLNGGWPKTPFPGHNLTDLSFNPIDNSLVVATDLAIYPQHLDKILIRYSVGTDVGSVIDFWQYWIDQDPHLRPLSCAWKKSGDRVLAGGICYDFVPDGFGGGVYNEGDARLFRWDPPASTGVDFIDTGWDGIIYAVAYGSGSTIAFGGALRSGLVKLGRGTDTGTFVDITGVLYDPLFSSAQRVESLDFSEDGSFLAVGLSNSARCLQVIRTSDWTRVEEYPETNAVVGVSWSSDSSSPYRLTTVQADYMRRYSFDATPGSETLTPVGSDIAHGAQVNDVNWADQGSLIALGGNNSSGIDVRSYEWTSDIPAIPDTYIDYTTPTNNILQRNFLAACGNGLFGVDDAFTTANNLAIRNLAFNNSIYYTNVPNVNNYDVDSTTDNIGSMENIAVI